MKRVLGLLVMTGMLVFPTLSFAGDQIGIYVSPKFVYGLTQMDGVKVSGSDDTGDSWSDRIGSRNDDAFGGSIAFGYNFYPKFNVPIRTELEYAGFSEVENKRTDRSDPDWVGTDKQTFGIQTLFLNAYWDIHTGTKFTPYLGAGLGMGFINTKWKGSGYDPANPSDSLSASSSSRTVTNFAWNLGAGVGYDFTENWTLDVGYRFVGLGSVKTKTASFDFEGDQISMSSKADNLYQHQFAVGLRYTF